MQTLSHKKTICRWLEIARWWTAGLGIYLAYAGDSNAQAQIHILTPWVVGGIAGLTGAESLFLGRAASEITGYTSSAYQRQSGLNNLALAITALLVWRLGWGTPAELAVITVLIIFLLLSSANHFLSAVSEHNLGLRNILRPVLTISLLAAIVPILLKALAKLNCTQ